MFAGITSAALKCWEIPLELWKHAAVLKYNASLYVHIEFSIGTVILRGINNALHIIQSGQADLFCSKMPPITTRDNSPAARMTERFYVALKFCYETSCLPRRQYRTSLPKHIALSHHKIKRDCKAISSYSKGKGEYPDRRRQ